MSLVKSRNPYESAYNGFGFYKALSAPLSAERGQQPSQIHLNQGEHIYEVSLLADRFGADAIPVLAAPLVPMFDGDTEVPSV